MRMGIEAELALTQELHFYTSISEMTWKIIRNARFLPDKS